MASPRPPPELMADLVVEILLRLPPADPACLIRASVVCKSWLRLTSDANFLRRYRAFHGAPPPLLAFLSNTRGKNEPRLVPFTEPTPFKPPAFDCSRRPWVMDCRHGRALLFDMWADSEGALAVWDPITGDRQILPKPGCGRHVSAAAVLCAAGAGCDHLDCHGGPFLVVCLGISATHGGVVDAHVYSSEAGSWGALASVQLGLDSYGRMNCGLVIRDEVYFTLKFSARILKYSLGTNAFSLIGVPVDIQFVLTRTEDDSLGLASVRDSNLYLWSRKDNLEGVAGWVNCRVIKLQAPFSTHDRFATSVIGFAEGVDVILVTANAMFAVELKSGKVTKVGRPGDYYSALPIMGFYTPDCGRRNHRHGLADF
ncbi:hypothetical protein SETIT_3G322100v2 [Setaria italica]|uniref:Uncharacterized protein n=1 Tax=Setaria italica TaxID=4555 RepID=K3Z794_SETIT|nr:uncharacterized protein LOC101759854 [Setaria italica]RCV18687.1 hypothetical protein SETIT_3G322100v2 [Setaria italica]